MNMDTGAGTATRDASQTRGEMGGGWKREGVRHQLRTNSAMYATCCGSLLCVPQAF